MKRLLDPQEVFDCIRDMPLEKLTIANEYKRGDKFCFAGWVVHKILGLQITENWLDSRASEKILNNDLLEDLTMSHISYIVIPKNSKQHWSKKAAKKEALQAIKEYIRK
jgi:hypothetical protein